jgi:hypothetical protein
MGQLLIPEKLGKLTQVSTTISVGAGVFNIGGQQYRTTSAISMTIPTVAVNQLYMLYLVIVGTTLTLVQDTALNSVGPTGYTAWRLVGAYYSNATNGFGGFVSIRGTPTSDVISYSPTMRSVLSFPVASNWDTQVGDWRRNGPVMECEVTLAPGTVTSVGSGAYVIPLPSLFSPSVPGTIYINGTSRVDRVQTVGTCQVSGNAGTPGWTATTLSTGTTFIAQSSDGNFGLGMQADNNVCGNGWYGWAIGSFTCHSVKATVAISGWTSTPLEDQ